jgi:hypothetical protein
VADGGLVCERDGVDTRLRCAGCTAGICPSCCIRTPAGFKCRDCTGVGTGRARSGRLVPAAVGLALVAVAAWLAVQTFGRSDEGPPVTLEADAAVGAASVGEEVRDGPLAFTVTGLECGAAQFGTPPAVRTAQGRYCVVRLVIRNEGTGPALFDGAAQRLVDGGRRQYQADLPRRDPSAGPLTPAVPAAGEPGAELVLVSLNPGIVAEGVLAFDLPASETATEIELHGPRAYRYRSPGVRVRLV